MRRRQLLTASAITMAGLAGCIGGDSTVEGSENEALGDVVTEFYSALYDDEDIDAANEMFHPDSEARDIVPDDFEPYGGLDSMRANVNDVEVVSESDDVAEVHATVRYDTPIGGATHTDWFVLQTNDGEWLIDAFVAESRRDAMSDEEVEDEMGLDD